MKSTILVLLLMVLVPTIVFGQSDPVDADRSHDSKCVLPHWAFGADWGTKITATNLSASYSTSPNIIAKDGNGASTSIFEYMFNGTKKSSSAVAPGLGPPSSQQFSFPPGGELKTGYFLVSIQRTLSGKDSARVSLEFTNYGSDNSVQGQATVFCVKPAYGFGLHGEVTSSISDVSETGIGIVNTSSGPVTVMITKRSLVGQFMDSAIVMPTPDRSFLNPGEKYVKFLHEMRVGWDAPFDGILEVTVVGRTGTIAVMALKTTLTFATQTTPSKFIISTIGADEIPGMEAAQ